MYGPTNRSSYAFGKSLKTEEEGNRHIFRLLAGERVQDVTKDAAFQKKGIDLIISRDGYDLSVDTKNDTYVSANFFAETMSVLEKGVKGCFITSQADFWFYYLLERGEIFVLPMAATREFVLANLGRFSKSRPIPNKGYHSEGYKVPWTALLENVRGIAHINIARELEFAAHAPSILPSRFSDLTVSMVEFLDQPWSPRPLAA